MEVEVESDSNELKYYKGRVKCPLEWKKLHNIVLKKLSTSTVIIFLIWFYEDLCEYLNESSNRIPGKFLIELNSNIQRIILLGRLCFSLFGILN